MEKTIKQTNTVAFMGKDQRWHFINEDIEILTLLTKTLSQLMIKIF